MVFLASQYRVWIVVVVSVARKLILFAGAVSGLALTIIVNHACRRGVPAQLPPLSFVGAHNLERPVYGQSTPHSHTQAKPGWQAPHH